MTLAPLRRAALRCAAAALLLAPACDRAPTTPVEEPLVVREMILRAADGDVVFSHTDHWHGAPVVREGEASLLTMYFTSVRPPPDEHDAPPVEQWFSLEDHPEYSVRAVIQDTTLARWSGDRVSGTLHGLRAGASLVSFVVRRGETTIYEAPPLNFRVQARP